MTRIVMDLKRVGHVISPLIHGQFIEHLGGCVYDGIWVGPESEIANVGGIRCDTLEALRRLAIPVMRWPGGLWADQYDWRDGIGPRDARPVRQNLGWDALESNAFGTHEFMAFCRAIGAEPFLCVNMGSGTVGLARDWAEYCNCAAETTWTRQRAANGDKNPLGVKYWGLGNEPFYTLDGRMRNVYYADLARNYAGFIKHVASQSHSNASEAFRAVKMIWAVSGDEEVVGNLLTTPPANELVDMLSIHFYAGRPPLPEKPEDPAVWRMREYRRAIGDLVKFEERIVESAQWARKLSTQEHTCRVAVDEWGTWYREATPENRLVQRITLGDALFAAGCLHVMQRHEAVAMANLAQTINVLSALIQTRGQEFVKTVMYDVWEMFRPHQGARFVPVEVEAPPATRVETADGQKDIPGVSVSVSREEKSGEVCVSLVNFDAQREARLTLEGLKGMRQREARILTAGDLFEGNTFAKPDGVRVREWDVQTLRGAIGLPARSVATICFQI